MPKLIIAKFSVFIKSNVEGILSSDSIESGEVKKVILVLDKGIEQRRLIKPYMPLFKDNPPLILSEAATELSVEELVEKTPYKTEGLPFLDLRSLKKNYYAIADFNRDIERCHHGNVEESCEQCSEENLEISEDLWEKGEE